MRFSIDANVLVYAFESGDPKTDMANRVLIGALGADCVLTNQIVGEFLNVIRRRMPDKVADAREAVRSWSLLFPLVPTDTAQLIAASALAARHHLQFWDSVILVVAGDAGADWLMTEDLQDGATINGVRLLDPFKPENAELLDLLLTPPPGTG